MLRKIRWSGCRSARIRQPEGLTGHRPRRLYALAIKNRDLKKENADLRTEAETRSVKLAKAGSIADASVAVSRLFEAAQAAADQYVNSVRAACEDPALQKEILKHGTGYQPIGSYVYGVNDKVSAVSAENKNAQSAGTDSDADVKAAGAARERRRRAPEQTSMLM